MLRIIKYNQANRDLYQDKSKERNESATIDENSPFDSNDELSNSNETHLIRPALFTTNIKKTANPYKLLQLWQRDRSKCRFDYINCSATLTHLACLSLKKLQKNEIYNKTMSWGLNRLIRDVKEPDHMEKYGMRQIANIIWSLGILASNEKNTHRDMRKLANDLVNKLYKDREIRRHCNVTHLSDILWSLNRLGLSENEWFYPWCFKLFVKLDTDIGCTPDAITNIGLMYAKRHDTLFNNKLLKNKDILIPKISKIGKNDGGNDDDENNENDSIRMSAKVDINLWNQFWGKLFDQFCDTFILSEANYMHIGNMLWCIMIAKPYLFDDDNINDTASGYISDYSGSISYSNHNYSSEYIEYQERIISNTNKLFDIIFRDLNNTDGQTLSIILHCVTRESKYPMFEICKKHKLFTRKENNIFSRVYDLLVANNMNHYDFQLKTLQIGHAISILQSSVELKDSFPNYVISMLVQRIEILLRHCNSLTKNELISLLNSLYLLDMGTESLYRLIGKKLFKTAQNCPKLQWNCKEFISIFSIINLLNDKYNNSILLTNLDLIELLLKSVSLTRQNWRGNWLRLEQFDTLLTQLENNLKQHNLLLSEITVCDENQSESDAETGHSESTNDNLSVILQTLQEKVKVALDRRQPKGYSDEE